MNENVEILLNIWILHNVQNSVLELYLDKFRIYFLKPLRLARTLSCCFI